MLLNSASYLVFLPVVIFIFYMLPAKDRRAWLLVSSYYFYICWNPKFLILLLISTVTTYVCGIYLEKKADITYRKKVIAVCIIINITILVVFKYSDFVIANINSILDLFKLNTHIPTLDLLLPVGISFYTFQVIGYIIDIYRGKIKAERNFCQYALFVSFFPQICAGPIERAGNMLHQFQNIIYEKVTYSVFAERLKKGSAFIIWGFFQKLVIADRAAILINAVFDNYEVYSSVDIIFAMLLYGVQIYCDFDGYTNIARGSATLLGIELMPNFRQPYLAVNIKDFWGRWHNSLTKWFTDYLYIPLGGNRKGEFRKYINIFIVFSVSGLWHGASWHFMLWGAMHGVFLVIYNLFHRKKSIKKRDMLFSSRIYHMAVTFLFVDFAWFFFRVPDLQTAVDMLKRMTMSFSFYLSFPNEIFSHGNMIILIFAIILLILIDILHEKNVFVMESVFRQQAWFYLLVTAASVLFILIFGVFGGGYDVSNFIYSQF